MERTEGVGGLAFRLDKGKKKRLRDPTFDSDEEVLETSRPVGELRRLGDAAASSGRWSVALRLWTEALAGAPAGAEERSVLLEQKAQVLLEVGETWQAIQSASKAVSERPTWAAAHLTLARCQLEYGEPELAVACLETALKLEPENHEAAEELSAARILVYKRVEAGAGEQGRRVEVRIAGGTEEGGGIQARPP